jgi:hypothetical protein
MDFREWGSGQWSYLRDVWTRTAHPWQQPKNIEHANQIFPVVADIGIPVRGLFILMVLFTVAIGPVNLYFLARGRRRIWMLWTVPLFSLVTCAAVFGYMLIAEGWEGHTRTEGLTILDETTHRAATIGWTACYTPVTPGDGLQFSYDTELAPQSREEPWSRRGGAGRTVNWTGGQHLASGWVTARVPSHFMLRKNETRRERVTVSRSGDGYTIVNGLGAEIRLFWYADPEGRLYTAERVAPGGQAVLKPSGESLEDNRPTERLRELYTQDWVHTMLNPGKPKRSSMAS